MYNFRIYSLPSITPVLTVPQGNLIPNYTNHRRLMQNKKGKEHISFTEILVNTQNFEKPIWVVPSSAQNQPLVTWKKHATVSSSSYGDDCSYLKLQLQFPVSFNKYLMESKSFR